MEDEGEFYLIQIERGGPTDQGWNRAWIFVLKHDYLLNMLLYKIEREEYRTHRLEYTRTEIDEDFRHGAHRPPAVIYKFY